MHHAFTKTEATRNHNDIRDTGRTLANAPAENCSGKPCSSCNGQGCIDDVNANSNANNAIVDLNGATVGGNAVVDQSGAIGGTATSNLNVQDSLNNNVAISNDVKVRPGAAAVLAVLPANTLLHHLQSLPSHWQVENNAVQNVKVEVDLDELERLVASLIKVIVSMFAHGKWRWVVLPTPEYANSSRCWHPSSNAAVSCDGGSKTARLASRCLVFKSCFPCCICRNLARAVAVPRPAVLRPAVPRPAVPHQAKQAASLMASAAVLAPPARGSPSAAPGVPSNCVAPSPGCSSCGTETTTLLNSANCQIPQRITSPSRPKMNHTLICNIPPSP